MFVGVDDLLDVMSAVMDIAHKWRGLGLVLRLKPALLSAIEADHAHVDTRLERVLTEWLKRSYDTDKYGEPSWEQLVAAVAHRVGGNDHALAETIYKQHSH